MARHRTLRNALGLLSVTLLLCSQAAAEPPFSQQQYLISGEGPYGYSTGDFRRATEQTSALESFDVPGYDITSTASPQDSNSATQKFGLEGWRLVVSVASDIPVPRGNPDSGGGTKVFDAALLSLSPPSQLAGTLDNGSPPGEWSVCSAVWTMGLSEAALAEGASASDQDASASASSCSSFLPQDCIAEMEAGFNSAGFCQNQTMPRSCAPFLSNGTDGVTRASNLPQTIGGLITNGSFFAATTRPLNKGDETALEAVSTWVFPVVLSWTHRGPSGSSLDGPEGDTRSHLACVRAAVGNPDERQAANSGDGIGSGAATLRPDRGWTDGWLLIGALAAWAAAVL